MLTFIGYMKIDIEDENTVEAVKLAVEKWDYNLVEVYKFSDWCPCENMADVLGQAGAALRLLRIKK